MLKKRKTKSKKQKEVNEKQVTILVLVIRGYALVRQWSFAVSESSSWAEPMVNRLTNENDPLDCNSCLNVVQLCLANYRPSALTIYATIASHRPPTVIETILPKLRPNRHTFETTVRLKPRRLGFLSSSLKRKTDAGYPLPVQTTTINAGPTVTN
ncbi:hypothetical protein T4B_9032 [Trichinella pseudospiralis]|uniref:Uncharacterized protein n=1 Tax=Trichinella pseudospiralis TaxID=6337 RepID=A0A0V1IE33_TRIPS|nr:hypothetical protein T4B_9032 [Trichinella pseudospiralis]KRZ41987.1 hypothetical protein T4C_4067 [Trichinella pseudospiralis]